MPVEYKPDLSYVLGAALFGMICIVERYFLLFLRDVSRVHQFLPFESICIIHRIDR